MIPARLIRDAEQHPGACQHERAERFGCSQRGVEAAEDQQGETFSHPKAEEEARRLFKRKVSVYELMRIPLIYIDESGFSEDMPGIFGHAPEGMRCFGKHGWQAKRRTDAAGALTGGQAADYSSF